MAQAPSGPMTALVKGAGPSGMAAAIALAQEGFQVTVAEKRAYRPPGEGRRNMVAMRPEALHQLDLLGALDDLRKSDNLTPITQAATYNEWDDSTFTWPLDTQPRYERPETYVSPSRLDEQVPSSFVNLGHLEDHLTQAAEKLGVEMKYSSTFDLLPADDGSDRYAARWASISDLDGTKTSKGVNMRDLSATTDLPTPNMYDIVVCASGKGDTCLEKALGFRRYTGVKIGEDNLPTAGSRRLRLGPDNEMETQRYLVFGLLSSARSGTLGHEVRKTDTGRPEQPVVEIEMRHAAASHYILQIPRGFREGEEGPAGALDQYVTSRVNSRQGTSFEDVSAMRKAGAIVWGDPLTPVRVETSTAPQFVFGSNVILVGDAGMSCSPTSGLGADVGMTHDGQAVRRLAQRLIAARNSPHDSINCTSSPEKQDNSESPSVELSKSIYLSSAWQTALDEFNLDKARGAAIWSKGSGWFYITSDRANAIVASVREVEAAA